MVVIGRRGRRVSSQEAEQVVFGDTAANGGAVHDVPRHTSQVMVEKHFLRHGSVFEVWVEGIGALRSRFVLRGRLTPPL